MMGRDCAQGVLADPVAGQVDHPSGTHLGVEADPGEIAEAVADHGSLAMVVEHGSECAVSAEFEARADCDCDQAKAVLATLVGSEAAGTAAEDAEESAALSAARTEAALEVELEHHRQDPAYSSTLATESESLALAVAALVV